MQSLSVSDGARGRLRKTFRYPDSDDDVEPEAMDEEEQQHLIKQLSTHNTQSNVFFNGLLLVLPILASIPCLLALVQSRSSNNNNINVPTVAETLTALTSVLATGAILLVLPPERHGLEVILEFTPVRRLRSWLGASRLLASSSRPHSTGALSTQHSRIMPRGLETFSTPQRLIVPLNLLLLALTSLHYVVLLASAGWSRLNLIGLRSTIHLLPPAVFGFVMAAKFMMASVDPEIELDGLRYGYKGA